MKLVKELNESNHVLEVPIFKQFHKFVIGKGGVNIRKVSIKFHYHILFMPGYMIDLYNTD